MGEEPEQSARETSAWELPDAEDAPSAAEAFIVDVEGFEGPLDLLLALARTQKVDLAHVSILALVEQYLTFINEAQRLKLEIAGDYLVMAAWLAFLKSRLLIPKEKTEDGQETAEEMAQKLSFRLARLEAMRNAMAHLMTRKRLGRDVFPRGMPEGVKTVRDTEWTAQIYDLLKAYADQRRRTVKISHVVKARKVWSIKDARTRLETLVGQTTGLWTQLDLFLNHYLPETAPAEEQKLLSRVRSAPRSKWRAKAMWNCSKRRPSPRFSCASAKTARHGSGSADGVSVD